ncbi:MULTISPECIES: hypothetical protein [Bacteria]|uniref:RraA family protein n=1 Tax=Bacteria TaxID=2 RepID=UPI003C7A7A6F
MCPLDRFDCDRLRDGNAGRTGQLRSFGGRRIFHGAIRDSVAIGALPLGAKTLGTNPRKSTKTGAGEEDIILAIAGVRFRPGAHLHADADGVLVER